MMINSLPPPDEDVEDPRERYVDGPLQVSAWPILPHHGNGEEAERPDGTPSWWQGDEEASQSFFRAARIDPEALTE